MAGGLGRHSAYRESNLSISVYPARFRYISILFFNILTLLAPTQSAEYLFHLFTVIGENENFLISSLHCFFANITPCPLVLLSSLFVTKHIFVNIFIPFQYFKHLNLIFKSSGLWCC